MINKYYVYCYYDEFNIPFYIGLGHGNRMRSHIWPSTRKDRKTTFYNKLNKMIDNNISFYYEKIKHDLSIEDAKKLEINLINKFGRRDLNKGTLCNLTDGGEGHKNYKRSKETIEKVRKKTIGQKRSDNFKKNCRKNRLGVKMSQDTKKKLSILNLGIPKPKPKSSLPTYKRIGQMKSKDPNFAKKMHDNMVILYGFPVLQIDPKTNNIINRWDNNIDAAKVVHGRPDRIRNVCDGIMIKHKKFYWKYDN